MTRTSTRIKLIDETIKHLCANNVYQEDSGAVTLLRDSLERGSLTTIKRFHTVALGLLAAPKKGTDE